MRHWLSAGSSGISQRHLPPAILLLNRSVRAVTSVWASTAAPPADRAMA
jgi:hypothetical protein